jgi:serine phosphatase RsbU (regulator of sigma subunit)
MMYGKLYIDIFSSFQTSSIIGTILVLCVIGIEIRGSLKNIILTYLIPLAIFYVLLIVSGKIDGFSIFDQSHIWGIILINIITNNIQENLRKSEFINNLKLEIEKNKSDALYQSIVEQKEEIEAQKEEIESQRDVAEEQRDKIISQKNEITSSIEYAKIIQDAMMPQADLYKEAFEDYFILYKPKDIVSGDFYWINKVDDLVIFALADCTGHGVPGAFMSMLGISALNELTGQRRITDADEILNELRNIIIDSLSQKEEFGQTKDGMDISLGVYDKKASKLYFAGANNSILLFKKRESNYEEIHIKGDKMPISIYRRLTPFTKHSIDIQKGDKIFFYSDGYPDQFGGEKSKKLKMRPFKDLLVKNINLSMSIQKEFLQAYLYSWMNYKNDNKEIINEQNDDIAVMGITF